MPNMKTFQVAAVVASLSGSVLAQWPSCATSCFQSAVSSNSGNWKDLCKDGGKLVSLNTCLTGAGCSVNDRNSANSYISSQCAGANAGASPSYTTPNVATVTNAAGWNSEAWSAYSSYVSAHPSGWSSSDYASFTSKYPLSQGSYPGFGGSWNGAGGGSGGGFGGGFGGWSNGYGPWGSGSGWSPNGGKGGPFGGNWGSNAWSSGSWCSGAFTNWWDKDSCPPATWPGWTSGTWSSSAEWTSWTACSASVTTSSVITTTSNGVVSTSTSYGYRLANAQPASTGGAGQSGVVVTALGAGAAQPTGRPVVGVAALALLGAVAAF